MLWRIEPVGCIQPLNTVNRIQRGILLVLCLLPAVQLRAATAVDLERDYGAPEQAISTREAGELLLKLVNTERVAVGSEPLELSRLASDLARQHATDMATNNYVGHYDLMGNKCERRYNLMGGTDYVTENVALREISTRVRLTPQIVTSLFKDWMGSQRHRVNMLDPWHTHMGYGFAAATSEEHTRIYAVQEFVNNYGAYDQLALSASSGQTIDVNGLLAPGGIQFSFLSIGSEPQPPPRTPSEVGEDDLRYGQPPITQVLLPGTSAPRFTNYQPEVLANAVSVGLNGREFSAQIVLPEVAQPTNVYVVAWAQGGDMRAPVRVMTQVVSVD